MCFEKHGARVVDADLVAQEVVEPTQPALGEIVSEQRAYEVITEIRRQG